MIVRFHILFLFYLQKCPCSLHLDTTCKVMYVYIHALKFPETKSRNGKWSIIYIIPKKSISYINWLNLKDVHVIDSIKSPGIHSYQNTNRQSLGEIDNSSMSSHYKGPSDWTGSYKHAHQTKTCRGHPTSLVHCTTYTAKYIRLCYGEPLRGLVMYKGIANTVIPLTQIPKYSYCFNLYSILISLIPWTSHNFIKPMLNVKLQYTCIRLVLK